MNHNYCMLNKREITLIMRNLNVLSVKCYRTETMMKWGPCLIQVFCLLSGIQTLHDNVLHHIVILDRTHNYQYLYEMYMMGRMSSNFLS